MQNFSFLEWATTPMHATRRSSVHSSNIKAIPPFSFCAMIFWWLFYHRTQLCFGNSLPNSDQQPSMAVYFHKNTLKTL